MQYVSFIFQPNKQVAGYAQSPEGGGNQCRADPRDPSLIG